MLIYKKCVLALSLLLLFSNLQAQVPQPVKQFLKAPYMRGATFSLIVKDLDTDELVYVVEPDLQITPASVMKLLTTASALELLGEDYQFQTVLEYDGQIRDSVLQGNLYIRGSGDPTLGSRYVNESQRDFLSAWREALLVVGIQRITGSVISDEGCFDTEGISPKWVAEDLGSYYGAGSYGLTVFDNNYKLFLRAGKAGDKPELLYTEPEIKNLIFHNYLSVSSISLDSSYIMGAPFASDRYLYGTIPEGKESYTLTGDIPDPALFLSGYVTDYLRSSGITVEGEPYCRRTLTAEKAWTENSRTQLCITLSPALSEIVRTVNEVSQNLYADVLLKTIGNLNISPSSPVLSSFGRGTEQVHKFWNKKGIDMSPVWMYDGSGLAVTSKVSARFMTDLLTYMRKQSSVSDAFYQSLPLAGDSGSVRNFLKGSTLQGNTRLKSGSMSRVKGYAGYINKKGKHYTIALFVNNYSCEGREMTHAIEKLVLSLF